MLTFYDFSVPGGGGGGEIIAEGTVSGGEITFTGLDLSSYKFVRLYFSGLTVAADDRCLGIQFQIDGGSFVTTGYVLGGYSRSSAAAGNNLDSASADSIRITGTLNSSRLGNATGESLSGFADISHAATTLNKLASVRAAHRNDAGLHCYSFLSGLLISTGSITGIKILSVSFGAVPASSLTGGRAFLQAF